MDNKKMNLINITGLSRKEVKELMNIEKQKYQDLNKYQNTNEGRADLQQKFDNIIKERINQREKFITEQKEKGYYVENGERHYAKPPKLTRATKRRIYQNLLAKPPQKLEAGSAKYNKLIREKDIQKYHKDMKEYRAKKRFINSPEQRKEIKEKAKTLYKQEKYERKNNIQKLKTDGCYDLQASNGETVFMTTKPPKPNLNKIINELTPQLEKPQKPVQYNSNRTQQMPHFKKPPFLKRIWSKIKSFFRKIFNRQEPTDKTKTPDPFETVKKNVPSQEHKIQEDKTPEITFDKNRDSIDKELNNVKEKQQRNNNLTRDFEDWLTDTKQNTVSPYELVFNYLQNNINKNITPNTTQISELLSYAFSTECTYNPKTNEVTMEFFDDKNNQVSATINEKGNISFNTHTQITPEPLKFLSNKMKENENLLSTILPKEELSQDSLKQVRDYIEKTEQTQFLPLVDKIEKEYADKNVFGSFNKWIEQTQSMKTLSSPEQVLNFALKNPERIMSQMKNPADFEILMPIAKDLYNKTYNIDGAFKLTEALNVKAKKGKKPHPYLNRFMILKNINQLMAKGLDVNSVSDIVNSYKNTLDSNALKFNIALQNYNLSQGVPIAEMTKTHLPHKIDLQKIADELCSKTISQSKIDFYRNSLSDIDLQEIKKLIPKDKDNPIKDSTAPQNTKNNKDNSTKSNDKNTYDNMTQDDGER